MDRGAWWASVHGVTRVKYGRVPEHSTITQLWKLILLVVILDIGTLLSTEVRH